VTDNVIHLPGFPLASTRDRLTEVRNMRRKIVVGKVTDLKTFRSLKNLDELLVKKLKLEREGDPNKPKGSGSNGPKRTA
jgi:hypothetical protein